MHASELKFIEEVYIKHKTADKSIYDEIVAVNIVVFLVRSGVCKIDPKDKKITYDQEKANSIIQFLEANKSPDQVWTRLGDTNLSLEHFIGSYSFITAIKWDIGLIPKICERQLTEVEQKLSIAENAHKPREDARLIEWTNLQPVPKAVPSQN